MNPKVLGTVQLVGGLLGAYWGYTSTDWAAVTFGVVFILMAVHHFMEKQ